MVDYLDEPHFNPIGGGAMEYDTSPLVPTPVAAKNKFDHVLRRPETIQDRFEAVKKADIPLMSVEQPGAFGTQGMLDISDKQYRIYMIILTIILILVNLVNMNANNRYHDMIMFSLLRR